MKVPPEQGITPRLWWILLWPAEPQHDKPDDTYHVYGSWGITEHRRSSPIKEIVTKENEYHVYTESGSMYVLYKDDEIVSDSPKYVSIEDAIKAIDLEDEFSLDSLDVPDPDIEYQEDDGNSNCDGGGCTI